MIRFTAPRALLALALLASLLFVWAGISAAWSGFVTSAGLLVSGGASDLHSPGASLLLPIVCAALVLVDLAWRRQAFWISMALLLTLGVELLLVVIGAAVHAPIALVAIPADVVQIIAPVGVLALALAEAREAR